MLGASFAAAKTTLSASASPVVIDQDDDFDFDDDDDARRRPPQRPRNADAIQAACANAKRRAQHDDGDDSAETGASHRPLPPYHKFVAASLTVTPESPFESANRWSAYEVAKCVVVGLTLFPLRLAVTLLMVPFALLFVWLSVAGLRQSYFDPGTAQPLAPWRNALLFPIRVMARIWLFALGYWWIREERVLDGGASWRVRRAEARQKDDDDDGDDDIERQAVAMTTSSSSSSASCSSQDANDNGCECDADIERGEPCAGNDLPSRSLSPPPPPAPSSASRSKADAFILVSNHVSLYESLYYYYRFAPAFVAKTDVRALPVIKIITEASMAIYVDRHAAKSRTMVQSEIARRARAFPPGAFPPLLMYPESTTTNGKFLIHFKLGAFVAGLPVQPMIVDYPHRHFDPSLVGLHSIVRTNLRMMLQFANFMRVRYLPVYEPDARERRDPRLYAENVRRRMAEALGVPLRMHDITDAMVQLGAIRRAPVAARTMNLQLRQFHGLVRDFAPRGPRDAQLARVVEAFARGDRDGDGLLTFSEWRTAMRHRARRARGNDDDEQEEDGGEENDAEAGRTTRGCVKTTSPPSPPPLPPPPPCQLARNLFDLLDIRQCGRVNFREYLVGLLFFEKWTAQPAYVDAIIASLREGAPSSPLLSPRSSCRQWLDAQFRTANWLSPPPASSAAATAAVADKPPNALLNERPRDASEAHKAFKRAPLAAAMVTAHALITTKAAA